MGEGVVESRLHRSLRNAEDGAGLVRGELLDHAEPDRLAVLFAERIEPSLEVLAIQELTLDRHNRREIVTEFDPESRSFLLPSPMPTPVEGNS